MQKDSFERYLDEIKKIPDEHLKEYASSIEKKIERHWNKTSSLLKQIIIIITAYFLLKNSIIDSAKIGPFLIKDINLILNFVPVAVAFSINNAASNFYSAIYHNFLLSLIFRRYFHLEERTLLLNKLLPINSEHARIKVGKKKVSLGSCLFRLPIYLLILILGILIIPATYYFVIATIIDDFNANSIQSIWTFWIPNVSAIIFLLLGIQHGVNLLQFVILKSKLYDEEDLRQNKKN